MNKITIKHTKGKEFIAECRSHKIVTDQPLDIRGSDNGPTPTELFVFSLGSCVGLYIEGFCKRGGIPCEGMEIKMTWELSKDSSYISKMNLDVSLPKAVSEERKKAILKVAEHCLVHNTIRNYPEIKIDLHEKG